MSTKQSASASKKTSPRKVAIKSPPAAKSSPSPKVPAGGSVRASKPKNLRVKATQRQLELDEGASARRAERVKIDAQLKAARTRTDRLKAKALTMAQEKAEARQAKAEAAAKERARKDRLAAQALQMKQAREQAAADMKAARIEAARLKEAEAQAKLQARRDKAAARDLQKQKDAEARKAQRALKKNEKEKQPRAPKPGLPVLKKGMHLDESRIGTSWDERPLTGRDLDVLCRQFLLTPSEFASALGLQNRFQFTQLLKRAEVVPYDVEMLARLYVMSPSPAPWQRYSAEQAFQEMYGSLVESFSTDPQERAYARTLFYTRFTAAMDRSGSTAYRWVEDKGDSRLVVSLFLRKLMSMKNHRATLEYLARLVHKNRLGNFDERAPYPVHGARLTRRGRIPKVDRGGGKSRDTQLPLDIKPFVL